MKTTIKKTDLSRMGRSELKQIKGGTDYRKYIGPNGNMWSAGVDLGYTAV